MRIDTISQNSSACLSPQNSYSQATLPLWACLHALRGAIESVVQEYVSSAKVVISRLQAECIYLAYDEAVQRADKFIQDLHLPPYRKLLFYDETGKLYIKEQYGDGSYGEKTPGIYDRSQKGAMTIQWNSPNEINRIAKGNPEFFAWIQSHMELKPNRIPHPFDGVIHSIEIHFEPGQDPKVRVCYTSGVQAKGWTPVLTEEDQSDPEYFNIFTTHSFSLSEFGISTEDDRFPRE